MPTPAAQTRKKGDARERILDVAEASVLAKGFDATSIDELIAAVGITKSGFFYHFRDKTELARALLERYIARETAMFDELFTRADQLNEDPLHGFLVGLKMLAELLADLPNGHPGCLIAATCYQHRLFDITMTAVWASGVISRTTSSGIPCSRRAPDSCQARACSSRGSQISTS